MATTSTQCGCRILVTSRICFVNRTQEQWVDPDGPGGSPPVMTTGARKSSSNFHARMLKWKEEIETFWNGPDGFQPWGGCEVRFEVIVQAAEWEAALQDVPGYHLVRVVRLHPHSMAGIGPASRKGEWAWSDTQQVVSHEIGHLMGLPIVCPSDLSLPCDEYNLPQPTHEEPLDGYKCIMMCTSLPVEQLGVPPAHIDEIVRGTGAACRWWCWLRKLFIWRKAATVLDFPGHYTHPIGQDRRPMEYADRPDPEWSLERLLEHGASGRVIDLIASLQATKAKLQTDGATAAGLGAATSDDDLLKRWIAVTALGSDRGGAGLKLLTLALEDEDVNIRIRAAESAARRGELRGIPALTRALDAREQIIGHPPERASVHAARLLTEITGIDARFDPNAPEWERERAKRVWEAWWDLHGDDGR